MWLYSVGGATSSFLMAVVWVQHEVYNFSVADEHLSCQTLFIFNVSVNIFEYDSPTFWWVIGNALKKITDTAKSYQNLSIASLTTNK